MTSGPYHLYGLSLDTPLRLPCHRSGGRGVAQVRLRPAGAGRLANARPAPPRGRDQWFQYRRLEDGTAYLRWKGLFEFLVSADGRQIEYESLPRASHETFAAYLLGQVLSFSLLALGEEPLHGTAVVVNGRAIGFLGDCGSGKSTLGAAFLHEGCSVLTDDVLALEPSDAGYVVHPGIPRIKLFPSVARRVLGREDAGVPLNYGTSKQILPLAGGQTFPRPAPLAALYVLSAPTPRVRDVSIETLSRSEAVIDLVRNTFNTVVQDRERLARQFRFASRLVSKVSVKRLDYARGLSRLPAVCEAVLKDVLA